MNKSWDSLSPGEIKKALSISGAFFVISLLAYIFFSKILGIILLTIWVFFGFGPFAFILESWGLIKNKVHVLKTVEPGYDNWKDEEIEKQIKAIEECGYKWFEKKGRVGFKHTKTGLYLKIEGLHFYKPEEIRKVYDEVWSKDDPSRIKDVEATTKKMAEAISSGATDEEMESILAEHKQKKAE